MPDQPLAYHITIGTYGARLHGDERFTVDRRHNEFGTPFIERDDQRRRAEQTIRIFPAICLKEQQRTYIETVFPSICVRGHWRYHIAAAQPDHVHALLTADVPARDVRRLLKRWLGQALDERWPVEQRWWAVGGSVKWIWDEAYFRNVFNYILKQRLTGQKANASLGTARL
jgi:REP element-mobilizing transposase RayT